MVHGNALTKKEKNGQWKNKSQNHYNLNYHQTHISIKEKDTQINEIDFNDCNMPF